MRTRWIIAGVAAAVGLVWLGQGLGILQGSSFMVGDGRWAIAGLGLLAVAAAIGWTALRNRRPT
jgi:predicted Co/Zn/Cd cation transporter (cation efflux family)